MAQALLPAASAFVPTLFVRSLLSCSYQMPTLCRHRWALIAIALAVGSCILFTTLTGPVDHFDVLALLPVFLYSVVALVIAYRRINHQLPLYVREPFASDITFRGPPTF